MFENILPLVIEDGRPESVAEDQRAESPDRKHDVHHSSTDLLNRFNVNEAGISFSIHMLFKYVRHLYM